jgi:hypothetical protein
VGKIKNDFDNHLEERAEEDTIQKEIETTMNFANNPQINSSLSFRTSI